MKICIATAVDPTDAQELNVEVGEFGLVTIAYEDDGHPSIYLYKSQTDETPVRIIHLNGPDGGIYAMSIGDKSTGVLH